MNRHPLECFACGQHVIARAWILINPSRFFCSRRCLRIHQYHSEADRARNEGVGLSEEVHQSTVEMGE